jgi:hypothetical protein
MDDWTAVFLVITALTTLTGFFFPFHKLLPSHILGVLSLIVLAIAVPRATSITSPADGAAFT